MSEHRQRRGEPVQHWHPDAESVRALAGVGEQFLTPVCPNGSEECAREGTAPCWDCLLEGGESDG